MQVPIISGIYSKGEFRTSYPINLVPVPKQTGIANGYLRPADGIEAFATGPGPDRGGIVWNDKMYRVMGQKLVRVEQDGKVTTIGDVGGSGFCRMDYSFDHLMIASGDNLFLYDGGVLSLVSDADLGKVVSAVFISGYFMATDGEFLVVTELNDPFAVNPLKYGSSEADPDAVVSLLRSRNEVYALNRNTIEVFSNTGGAGFPFQRIEGAQVQKGCVGTNACCVYMDAIAFIGGGRGEAVGVYIAANGSASKVSTREIDQVLAGYSDAELAGAVLEQKVSDGHAHLIVRLARDTMVYDAIGSQAIEAPVWFYLSTGGGVYQAGGFTRAYGRFYVGAGDRVGVLTTETGSQFGEDTPWEFATPVMYNEGRGAIVTSLEVVCLHGSPVFGDAPRIETMYSPDGLEWSQPKSISAGAFGQRTKRLVWRNVGTIRNFRMQRFTGTSMSPICPARLEVQLEPLAW